MSNGSTMRWSTQLVRCAAALLVSCAVGCDDTAPPQEPSDNTSPSIREATQSAARVPPLSTATFHVVAQDDETRALRFSWKASTGVLGTPADTDTTSEITWTAPGCGSEGPATITVTVTDEWDSPASKAFTLSVDPCPPASLASGDSHALALSNDGTVWAWGNDSVGQLGDGRNLSSPTPVRTLGLTDIIAVAAGTQHSLALRKDGTVWAWGYNTSGQLGDGTTTSQQVPVQVSGLTGITAIEGGLQHSLAVRDDGTVWTWGANDTGQLGDGTTALRRLLPMKVAGLTGITAIAGGAQHSVALRNDGTVWAWGDNSVGHLGDGTTDQSLVPVQVLGMSRAVALASGTAHSLAVLDDGTLQVWGYNRDGQLGDGFASYSALPIQARFP